MTRPATPTPDPWSDWSEGAFTEAKQSGSAIFLLIENVWCSACVRFRDDVLTDHDVAAAILADFVPLRVDGDRMPHIQERYIAGGWPTVALLTGTGDVLWSAPAPEAAALANALRAVAGVWRNRRTEIEAEIDRRRVAIASRRRQPADAILRPDAARDVLLGIRTAFDERDGGFGSPPRFPPTDTLELLWTLAAARDDAAGAMATRTLEGMYAGELRDTADGGFFRYALAGQWANPRFEKVLDTHAGLLRAYALGGVLHDRAEWTGTCDDIVGWVEKRLARADGLWGGSQIADDAWHATPAAERGPAPPGDGIAYTDRCALWIAALSDAGRLLDRVDWRERATASLDTLLSTALRDDGVRHWRADGDAHESGLLVDAVALLRACLAVGRTEQRFVDAAKTLGDLVITRFASNDALWDRVHEDGAIVRDRQKPFHTNIDAARALLSLTRITGEERFRDRAERILALCSRTATRYGTDAAGFVLAMNDLHSGDAA